MIRKFIITLIMLVIGIVAVIATCWIVVENNADGRTFDTAQQTPHNKYGLLLATSPVTSGGRINLHFVNRIDAADRLFKAGKIDYIIASGGVYRQTVKNGCDEPSAIRDSLMTRDIPDSCIILDYEGRRTINSIVKAKEVYSLDSITLISQEFHNKRALYLADYHGLEAIGFNATPTPIRANHIKNIARETLARVKMFVDLLLESKPHFNESESPNT